MELKIYKKISQGKGVHKNKDAANYQKHIALLKSFIYDNFF